MNSGTLNLAAGNLYVATSSSKSSTTDQILALMKLGVKGKVGEDSTELFYTTQTISHVQACKSALSDNP